MRGRPLRSFRSTADRLVGAKISSATWPSRTASSAGRRALPSGGLSAWKASTRRRSWKKSCRCGAAAASTSGSRRTAGPGAATSSGGRSALTGSAGCRIGACPSGCRRARANAGAVSVKPLIDTWRATKRSSTLPSRKALAPSNARSSTSSSISTPRPKVIGPGIGSRRTTGFEPDRTQPFDLPLGGGVAGRRVQPQDLRATRRRPARRRHRSATGGSATAG